MADIAVDKLIIGASIIFFVGIFVFAIIFKALMLVGDVENSIGVIVGNNDTQVDYYVTIFQLLPWILGFMYIVFVGGVIYIVLTKGAKKEVEESEEAEFSLFGEKPVSTQQKEEITFEDIFYK